MPPLSWAPSGTPIAEGIPQPVQGVWVRWLRALVTAINSATRQLQSVRLTAQAAAIATTTISTAVALTTGRYSVRSYLRITQAATTSSSATVTLSWTDGGIACSQSFAAVTGNTTATTQSGAIVVRADAGTVVRYAVAYASVGGTVMQYALDLCLEELPQ